MSASTQELSARIREIERQRDRAHAELALLAGELEMALLKCKALQDELSAKDSGEDDGNE